MRKFVKTAAVLALALALLSTSAFAALSTEGSGVVRNTDGTFTATIAGAAADEQITILATDVNDLASVTDANIFYINQKAATGTSDSFANFNLKNVTPGTTYYFFAGSATSSVVTPLGSVATAIPYEIELGGDAEIEVGQTATIAATVTPAGYDGEVDWTVSSEAATLTPVEGGLGATLTSTVEGTYTVTATLDNDASATFVVTVKPKNVTVPTANIVSVAVEADGEIAENQNGVGVAFAFADLPAGFTRMIWGFGDGSGDPLNRRYSKAMELAESVEGACVIKAAFGNGTKSGSIAPYAFAEGDVSAIFYNSVDGDTYFTHPALDKGNELKENN